MADQTHRNKMTDTYVKIQIVGTPDECLQQIAQLRQYTGLDHLVCEFGYGGLPHHEAELNMRLSPIRSCRCCNGTSCSPRRRKSSRLRRSCRTRGYSFRRDGSPGEGASIV